MPDANAPVAERTAALVTALQREGYAASARPVAVPVPRRSPASNCARATARCSTSRPSSPSSVTPRREAFSELLGVHVQRLATLAQGDHVCTTFVRSRRSRGQHRGEVAIATTTNEPTIGT